SSIGLITDLAGNLLPTYTTSPEKACIEKIPPRIRLTTAIEGDTKLYVVFTEPILQGPFPGTTSLAPADFVISGTDAFGINSVTVLNLVGGGVVDCYLNLDRAITASDMLYLQMNLQNTIIDLRYNQADSSLRRAVDIGMGVVNVVAASDGIHADAPGSDPSLTVSQLGTLRVFDGTGRLYDRDITIYTALDISRTASYTDPAALAAIPLTMFFDGAFPPDSSLIFSITGRDSSLQYWLPVYKPGFNRAPNTDARSLAPFLIAPLPSTNRNFLIPSADPDMVSGTTIGFLFRYGDLFLAREAVPGDPRSFALWEIKIQDVIKQKGGVTILNNVINVLKRERTTLQLDLAQGGQVTVMVFTLDGDVVTTLHRGRLGAGTYNFVWDGTNMAGLPVARGIYFIRVVAPGIDEIRKVIVIKE
ncbi:MAG TPA: FlgD immunoglobulin-like domain containing protein, partial [Spirochaetia bacterium]|nr:FlgD immunoglobulin-like domain containing protein [Spirochaetia bacterium]